MFLFASISVLVCTCMYACLCGHKKSNCLVPHRLKKPCLYVLYIHYSIMEFKCLQSVFYVQRVIQTEQFVHVLFKTSHGMLYYSVPHPIVMHYAICSRSAKVCLHRQTTYAVHLSLHSQQCILCAQSMCSVELQFTTYMYNLEGCVPLKQCMSIIHCTCLVSSESVTTY